MNDTPAPYLDNVSGLVTRRSGPSIVAQERYLANDGFPASGTVSTQDRAANSVRFDMAANIAPRDHERNDPGDSIVVDITPRTGSALNLPVMYWTLARRNALYDPYRSLPPNPVWGRVRAQSGGIIANRYNFDLPDTGMLFPGDVLHYYIAATDILGGDARTATIPADVSLQLIYCRNYLSAWIFIKIHLRYASRHMTAMLLLLRKSLQTRMM